MAPLPTNNTAVFFLDYSVAGETHTLQMRCDETVTDTDASATMFAFLNELDAQVYESTVVGFRFRQAGSNVTLPAVWSATTTWGTGVGNHDTSARYIDFVGRDSDGRRVRATVFGAINIQVGNDYRTTSAEATYVADAIAQLTSDAQMFWTIAGNVPVWNQYTDIGVNAYWRNKIR